VWDKDPIKKDDFLGYAEIDLSTWVTLFSVLGKSTSYTLELLSDDTKAKGKKATGTLEVEVTIAAMAAAAA